MAASVPVRAGTPGSGSWELPGNAQKTPREFQPGYIRRLKELSPLLGKNVYLVTDYEIGKAYGPFNTADSRLPMDFNAAVLVQSFIGPVVFGGSVGDRGHHKFYFQLGRLF